MPNSSSSQGLCSFPCLECPPLPRCMAGFFSSFMSYLKRPFLAILCRGAPPSSSIRWPCFTFFMKSPCQCAHMLPFCPVRMSAAQRQDYSIWSPPNRQSPAWGLESWGTQSYLLDDTLGSG